MLPAQDLRAGGRQSDSQYQFTLWSADIDELAELGAAACWTSVKQVAGIVDVTTDREHGGLQANVVIDRAAAARLGVASRTSTTRSTTPFRSGRSRPSTPSATSTGWCWRSIRRLPARSRPISSHIYVAGARQQQVPLSAVAHVERGIAPLAVQPPGPVPGGHASLQPGCPTCPLEAAPRRSQQAVGETAHARRRAHRVRRRRAGLPASRRRAAAADRSAALIAVYIVLGVLYESLAHPLTIISTLPSAGLGALLALQLFGTELTVIAFIGIILLIGIVKKNGIMMVDFALDGERQRGLPPAAGDPRGLPGALPPDPDDHAGGAARRAAAGDRHRPRLRAAPAARHHHHRRPAGVAGADALHDAGDLSAARPAAPPARRRSELHLHRAAARGIQPAE